MKEVIDLIAENVILQIENEELKEKLIGNLTGNIEEQKQYVLRLVLNPVEVLNELFEDIGFTQFKVKEYSYIKVYKIYDESVSFEVNCVSDNDSDISVEFSKRDDEYKLDIIKYYKISEEQLFTYNFTTKEVEYLLE